MKLISLLICLFSIIKTKALECVSVVHQECIARPKIIDVNKNELVFYPLSIKINECNFICYIFKYMLFINNRINVLLSQR